MSINTYGDIGNRTAAYAVAQLLDRGIPFLVLEKFGQSYPIPKNKTKTVKFRRFEALDPTPKYLVEGVTPSGSKIEVSDVECLLRQMGDMIIITDVVMDTNEDPVLNENIDVLGEQAAQMVENMRFGVLKAGTNVFYGNKYDDTAGTARTDVAAPITLAMQRKITRALKRQNAIKITRVLRSTPSYGTKAVAPSFIALCHTDCEKDIRSMDGFVPIEDYGSITPYEMEIGKVEDCRYLATTTFVPWEDAGDQNASNLPTWTPTGGTARTMLSTSGVQCDVYPILYIAKNSYGIVPLKGANSLTPMVVNPKPSDSDPLAQRGHIGWKTMQTCVILNDAWMARAEVGVSD